MSFAESHLSVSHVVDILVPFDALKQLKRVAVHDLRLRVSGDDEYRIASTAVLERADLVTGPIITRQTRVDAIW